MVHRPAGVIEWWVVGEHPEPERVEIELTSNAAERDRSHHHPPPPAGVAPFGASAKPRSGADAPDLAAGIVAGPVGGNPPPTSSDQRRLMTTAAIVGVVAMLLGWLVGRSGGSDEVATTSATVPVTTERVLTSLLPGETLPSASTTTTRPPRTTTTSTLAPPQRSTVDVDPRLAGVDLTLIAVEQQRFIVELDLESATLLRRDLGRISTDPGTMIAGEDWIVIAATFDGRTLVIRDDGVVDRVDLGEPWQLLWQFGTDRFWRSSIDGPYGAGARYTQVDLEGEPTGVTIELPSGAWSWQTDPLGGLIVQASGTLYRVDVSVIEVIGSGDLIGVSNRMALTRECDAQLRCGLVSTDRATGESRWLDTTDAAGEPVTVESLYGWGPGGGSSVSPDGSMAAVILPSPYSPAMLSLVDLATGVVVELGAIDYTPQIVWSPDGRFAFFLHGQESFAAARNLQVFDRESGEIFPVFPEPVDWTAMAARPSSG